MDSSLNKFRNDQVKFANISREDMSDTIKSTIEHESSEINGEKLSKEITDFLRDLMEEEQSLISDIEVAGDTLVARYDFKGESHQVVIDLSKYQHSDLDKNTVLAILDIQAQLRDTGYLPSIKDRLSPDSMSHSSTN